MTFFKNLKIVLSLDFEKNLLSQGKSFLLIHFTENARFCSWVLLFFFSFVFFFLCHQEVLPTEFFGTDPAPGSKGKSQITGSRKTSFQV